MQGAAGRRWTVPAARPPSARGALRRETRADDGAGRGINHLVAGGGARVAEPPACLRCESPLVSLRAEGQLKDARGDGVGGFAVRLGRLEVVVALAAGAYHELAEAPQ